MVYKENFALTWDVRLDGLLPEVPTVEDQHKDYQGHHHPTWHPPPLSPPPPKADHAS